MNIEGDFTVAAPPETVWQVLLDPDRLCRVLPGCESATQVDPTHFDATLAAKVQFMTIRARTAVELLEVDEPRRLTVEMIGETLAMAGAFRARATVDLQPAEAGTAVRYAIDMTMLGRLGSLGEPIVRSTAKRLAGEFVSNMTRVLEEEHTT